MSPISPIPLVQLHNGREGLRTSLAVEIRDASDASDASVSSVSDSQPSTINSQPCLDFISSDETLDRYEEIISAHGWKLDTYRKNPVFQNAHQYGDILFTLGKALITEIRHSPSSISHLPSTHLFQRIQFATDVNPMARIAYGLYKGKFLNAVSVGFIPLRWQDFDSSSSSCSSSSSSPKRRYLEQELLEVSAVAIPANPNALALGLKSGALEKSDLRDTADLLRSLLSGSQPSTINHQLLRMARQLRDILKHA